MKHRFVIPSERKVVIMKTKIMLFLILALWATGCAHRLEVDQLPPGSDDFLPSEVGLLIPAILEPMDVRENGEVLEPSREFTRLVLQKIQRTYVFSQVSSAAESGQIKQREKAVKLALSLNAYIDTNQATNWIKFSAVCASLFLLRPVLYLSDDFDVTAMLKATRQDGAEKYYKSRFKGTINYRLFGAMPAKREAREVAVEKLLNSLMRQVMGDINYFAMQEEG